MNVAMKAAGMAAMCAPLGGLISCVSVPGGSVAYRAIVEGRDWGPAVTLLAVGPLDAEAAASLDAMAPSDIRVISRQSPGGYAKICDVTRTFPSDADGQPQDGGPYRAIALKTGSSRPETTPMVYDNGTARNRLLDLSFDVTLPGSKKPLPPSPLGTRWVGVEDFELGGSFVWDDAAYGKIALGYAFRTATGRGRDAGEKRPLVVWLHGAGEGGTDTRLPLVGNRVVNLASPEIQAIFGGADILAPQSPTMWMDDGTGAYTSTGKSKYSAALQALIAAHVAGHPETDASRVYLGGCSNGGFMTVLLIADNPGFYAAGWPVCEAYFDAWLSGSQAANLAKTPLWFTHAKDDPIVKPGPTSLATVKRLEDLGAEDVRLSLFPNVKGDDGESYIGHFSWIYALKNRCVAEDGTTLMGWLAARRL